MTAESFYNVEDVIGIMMPQWKIPREYEVRSVTVLMCVNAVRVTYNGILSMKGRTVSYNVSYTEEDLRRYNRIYNERYGVQGQGDSDE